MALGCTEIHTAFDSHGTVSFPISVQRSVSSVIGSTSEIGPAFGGTQIDDADWERGGFGCRRVKTGRGSLERLC